MRIEQYFSFECDQCGEVTTLDAPTLTTATFIGGMAGRRCPDCGTILAGEPEAVIDRVPTPERGLYECFECGHTFGYAAGFDNQTETPNCTSCGSDNVMAV